MRKFLCIAALLCCSAPVWAQPVNDECVDATAVGEGDFAFDNTLATDSGPIDCDGNMTTDVWFLYTATVTADVEISTCNSAGTLTDTTLIVYDGAACPLPGDLGLACDDDTCAGPGGGAAFLSSVTIPVVSGGTYLIQVGGWNGSEGDGTLSIGIPEVCDDGLDNDGDGFFDCEDTECAAFPACDESLNCGDGLDNDLDGDIDCADADCASDPLCLPPITNDECVDATPVGEGAFPFNNIGATTSGPVDCDGNMTGDVWFLYTATITGNINISTCESAGSLTDTTLITYDGAACPLAGDLGLACDDDTCSPAGGGAAFLSQVTLPVTAGDMIYVQVGGWNGSEGDATLFITEAENCASGVDEDLDGLIDCDDPDCAADPACFESDCADGLDNDTDGLIDCEDPDCVPTAVCDESLNCADGIDNDLDGDTDCADADCAADAACLPPILNDECVDATPVGEGMFDFHNVGSTSSGPIDCDGNMTTDVWFLYTATITGNVRIETCGGTGTLTDTTLIIYDGAACPLAGDLGLACDDDSCSPAGGGAAFLSSVTVAVTAGDSIYVQVGGWNGSEGTATLSIVEGENCSSGVDEDLDGLIDCDDPDCSDDAACPEDCTDGVDNDANGLVDCADPDCATDPACFETICDDGIDNDGDGVIDCDDVDCFGQTACIENNCGDGLDDDGDGLIDCDDADCDGDPICAPANDLCVNAEAVGEGDFPYSNDGAGLDGPTDCDGNMTGDVWFLYTATFDGDVVIETCQTTGTLTDTTLIVYAGSTCPVAGDPGLACDDDTCAPAGGGAAFLSQVVIPVTTGETFLVQVGGWNGSQGDGTLSITAVGAEICGDGLDNDLDGLTDCADDDCSAEPECDESLNCGDGIDNDVDGTTDCFDTDCVGDPACPSYDGEANLVINQDSVDGDEGAILDADALGAALAAAGADVVVIDNTVATLAADLLDPALENIWVTVGTFPADNTLTEDELNLLYDAQQAGKNVYVSGGDQWGFAGTGASLYGTVDGVDEPNTLDGNDEVLSVDGADSGVGIDASDLQDVAYAQDTVPGNDWTDQLAVADSAIDTGIDAAGRVFGVDDAIVPAPGYAVVVAATTALGNTISSSIEFGGLGDATLQTDIAGRYLAHFGGTTGGPTFRRGDANDDGAFNIADVIYIANALFVPGSPGFNCDDAADTNDDGAVNIADAIYGANALFVPGSPAPPAPGPNDCGEDPTDDPTTCDLTNQCP